MSEATRDALTITPLGDGRYRIARPGQAATTLFAVSAPEGVWVWDNGRALLIRHTHDVDTSAGVREDDLSLATPMPATVRSITVREGDTVAEGALLVLLEAMKMELAIKAPRAGRVRTVRCRPGDLVQPGTPLVELE